MPDDQKIAFERTVEVATGGAAPPSAVIAAMQRMGFRVLHLYGLTETYGPATFCAWQSDWDDLDAAGRAGKMALQGCQVILKMCFRCRISENQVGVSYFIFNLWKGFCLFNSSIK